MQTPSQETVRSIGLLGGTFDPIHIGHLLLAQQAKEELALEEVWFLPSGLSYMKRDRQILPGQDRLRLVRLAIADNPAFSCSDLEVRRGGNTYTWETLQSLRAQYPACAFTFLAGADSLFQLENWQYPQRLFDACRIAIAARDDRSRDACLEKARQLRARYGADIVILETRRIDISSSQIRGRCARGESIRYLVPEPVREEIVKRGFYGAAERAGKDTER